MKLILSFIILLFSSLSLLNANEIKLTPNEKQFIQNNPLFTVGAEMDWPPFDFVDNNQHTGVARDYLNLIEKKTGLKFKYEIDSWENLLQKTKQKSIDILPSLSKSADREKFLLFTDKYITTRDYLIAKKSSQDMHSISDLDGKTIAIVKSYVQDEIFQKKYPTVNIYYVDTFEESLDAIITNKADFIIANIAIINYHIQNNGFTQLEPKFYIGDNWNNLYMAVGHHNPILLNIIQKAINSITKEEETIIYKKWFNTEKVDKAAKLSLSQEELKYIKQKKDLIIANELDWVPFDYNENETPKGYIIDYIKIVTKKLGLNPIFITKKWADLEKDFKNGEIDLLPVISYNKKREDYLLFTHSHTQQALSITVKKSRDDIISIDDLSDKKLGMMKSWNLTNILKKEYPNINIIEFDSLDDIFDAIQNGFIDATIQNNTLSHYYINKSYYGILKSDIEITLKGFAPNLYMGVRKDLPIVHRIINKAIISMSKKDLLNLENKWIKPVNNIAFTKEEKEFINNTKINIITDSKWAPFSFHNHNEIDGISIDFWKYIEKKTNLKSNIKVKDKFSDAVNSFQEQKSDMILAIAKTTDNQNLGIFTNHYMTVPIGIATLNDKKYIGDAKQLLNKKIAVGRSFAAHKLLEAKYPKIEFVLVDDVKEGLEYVSNDQAYAYVDIMPVLTHSIEKYSFTNIKISGQTGIDFKLVSMIRSDYPLLKSIIDKTIRNMSYEDKEKILSKWLKAKYEKAFDYSLLWKIVLGFMIILFFVLYRNRQLQMYQIKLERSQAETQNSLENFKKVMNLNIAGILIIKNKKILYTNDEILRILEFNNSSELLNKDISLVLDEADINKINSGIKDSNESYDTRAKKSNKEIIPVLIRTNSIVFENKNAIILSIVDLSDIKNKEEIILQQSKMASLGEMIGNIAHQWRQPLSYISTAASGMKLQKEFNQLSDEEFIKLVDGITDTTMFLSQTIDDFRDYIKGEKVKKEFEIKSCINRVLSLMDGAFKNNFITVDTDIEDNSIIGFENELNQVLLNLLSNSKDALKDIKQENRKLFINSYKKEEHLTIEVIDSGGGLQDDVIKKVFEPYFTTKHQSQGTGLGLYMTHNIIKKSMNGQITIENISYKEYKKCAKVTIILPL